MITAPPCLSQWALGHGIAVWQKKLSLAHSGGPALCPSEGAPCPPRPHRQRGDRNVVVPHFVRPHRTKNSGFSLPWRRGWHLTMRSLGVTVVVKGAQPDGGRSPDPLPAPSPPPPGPAPPLCADSSLMLFLLAEAPSPPSVTTYPEGPFASSDLGLQIHHLSQAGEILAAETDRQTSKWANDRTLRLGNGSEVAGGERRRP